MLLGAIAAAAPPRVPGPPHNPRTLARAILADTARYHVTQPQVRERPKSWLQRAWDWAALQWGRLLHALLGNVRLRPKTGVALGGALLLLIALLSAAALAKVAGALWRGPAARAPSAGATPLLTGAELYERSLAAAERHAFTRAFELLFAATIATLERRGVTRCEPSATVGDVRRDVRERAATLVAAFDAVAAPFTAAVYAARAPGHADWENANAAFLTLLPGRDVA